MYRLDRTSSTLLATLALTSSLLSTTLLADPCCKPEDTFSAPVTNVALYENSGTSDRFHESSSFQNDASGSAGFESVFTEDLQIYNIPVYHGIPISLLGGEEFINLAVLLPYVTNEVGLYDNSGLGDLYFGGQYYYGRYGMVHRIGAGIKLATGDYEEGLGTDSVDFSVFGGISKRIAKGVYSFAVAYTFKGSTDDDFIDYGDQFNVKVGYKHQFNRLVGVTSAFLLTRQANHEYGSAGFQASGSLNYDLHLGVEYQVRKNILLNAGVNLPVSESSLDHGDPLDRDPTFKFHFSTDY